MSTEKLRLEVLLAAIDKVTGPLKAITKGSGDAARALRAAKDQLKDIEGQQKAIAAFKDADKAAAITANAFKGVQEQVKHLQREMAKTPEPTRAMIKALKDAQAESDTLKNRHAALMDKQQRLFAQMKAGGIDTRNLANHSRDLATRQIEAARSVDKLKQSLEDQNRTLARMHAARANYDKSMANSAKLRNAGMVAAGAGAAMSLPVVMATKDYATFEDAMLGVARQVEGARDDNGKLTKTYYEMGDAIKAMSERIPMTTVEIAKIVEAGARMGIQGEKNILTYTQVTATMAHAFDLPVDKLGEDMAKIAMLFKQPIDKIGEMGDAINWLDDKTVAKGGEIIEVMKRIAGTAQMVKMNFREAAALGSTFLTLGAVPEVAASASNAMIRELSIATMQTKRFRGGLEMLKLDAKALQFGMSQNATGTIMKVLEAIKALPQEKQLEAATRLFGKEFGDDAAKLAENLDEYRRQLGYVNAERAKGSMKREADTRKDSINARMTMAKNAFFNLSSDLGQHLKPAIAATLEKIVEIAQAVRTWAKENPALASGIMTTVKWVALFVTVLGGGLIALAGLGAAVAMLKFGLAALGLVGGPVALVMAAVQKLGGSFMWVTRLFPRLLVGLTNVFLTPSPLIVGALSKIGAMFPLLARGLLFLGRAMLMNPLGLLITAALLIYTYWEPISKFFGSLWSGVAKAFNLASAEFKAWWAETSTWFATLPAKLMEIGAFMMEGLANGIKSGWKWVKESLGGLAKLMPGYVEKPLDIHSPSRVFEVIGGHTMAGLEQGIQAARKGPLGALAAAAKQLTAAGAGLLIGGAAAAGGLPAIDIRPPISPGGMSSGASAGGNTYVFQIYPSPGMDEQALASMIERKLRDIDAQRAAGRRSRLVDAE